MTNTHHLLENPENYFSRLVQEAQKKLLSEPFLHQLEGCDKKALHYFFSQLYYFVDLFPGLLGIVLSRIPDKNIQFVIVENIVDECGGIENIKKNDFTQTHSELLKYFIEKIQS